MPGGVDPQAVEVEAESDLDVAGHSHDAALVLPPVRHAGVTPHREVLVPGVNVRKVVEQIDHRPAHLLLAVTPYPFPRLPRRLAAQLEQHLVRLLRPAVEARSHVRMLATDTDKSRFGRSSPAMTCGSSWPLGRRPAAGCGAAGLRGCGEVLAGDEEGGFRGVDDGELAAWQARRGEHAQADGQLKSADRELEPGCPAAA